MDFLETVQSRRSVHQYSEHPIPEETLEAIVRAATLAPSGYNLQPWEFLALREEKTKETLTEVAHGQEHIQAADTAVVVLGNTDPEAHAEAVFEDWLEKGYIPDGDVKSALLENVAGMAELPETERRIWATRSTALAAMTLMFAAWDHGVASCPMEGFDHQALKAAFDIPAEYEPIMIITLGYPAEEAQDLENDRKGRRPVEDVLHYEEFTPATETTLRVPSLGQDMTDGEANVTTD